MAQAKPSETHTCLKFIAAALQLWAMTFKAERGDNSP